MSKQKMISDSALLSLIKEYFDKECKGNARKLKLPLITAYIASHGYPSYQVTTLRRNEKAREYIDSLIKANTAVQDVIIFKPLDIEDFLSSNRTPKALRTALSSLDSYYHTIAETSNAMNQNYKSLEKKCEKLTKENEELKTTASEYKQLLLSKKAEIKELGSENDMLYSIVTDYVYPEIANELLKRDGDLVKEQTTVKAEQLDKELVYSKTNIDIVPEFSSGSNVIRGLFQSLEDNA